VFKAIGGAAAFLAAIATVVGVLYQIGVFHGFGGTDNSGPPNPPPQCASAEITLSSDTAARGSRLTVYGSCFDPGELVEIRIHVTSVGTASADTKGSFTQTVTVPQSAPPPDFPTEVSATGHNSVKTASAPFSTTS
jgi:hypothetical protein